MHYFITVLMLLCYVNILSTKSQDYFFQGLKLPDTLELEAIYKLSTI